LALLPLALLATLACTSAQACRTVVVFLVRFSALILPPKVTDTWKRKKGTKRSESERGLARLSPSAPPRLSSLVVLQLFSSGLSGAGRLFRVTRTVCEVWNWVSQSESAFFFETRGFLVVSSDTSRSKEYPKAAGACRVTLTYVGSLWP